MITMLNPFLIKHPFFHDEGLPLYYELTHHPVPDNIFAVSFEGSLVGKYETVEEAIAAMLKDVQDAVEKDKQEMLRIMQIAQDVLRDPDATVADQTAAVDGLESILSTQKPATIPSLIKEQNNG